MLVNLFISKEESEMNKEELIARYGEEAYSRNLSHARKLRKEHPEKRIVYMEVNRNRILKQQREYKKNNKVVIAIQRKGYIKDHKEELAEYQRRYRETSNGKAAHNRGQALRKRNFRFITLNSYFEGGEGHHIAHNFVVHIPTYIHKSIWHNLNTGQGMEIINTLALDFLVNGF